MTTEELKKIKLEGFKNFKKDNGSWKPMFRGKNGVASPNLWASTSQRDKIYLSLDNLRIDAYNTVFILNNRTDGIIREKKLFDLSKGDSWDIITAIRKKKVSEMIKTFRGKCMKCGEMTEERHKFTDDFDEEGQPTGYSEWCCDECFDDLQESL